MKILTPSEADVAAPKHGQMWWQKEGAFTSSDVALFLMRRSRSPTVKNMLFQDTVGVYNIHNEHMSMYAPASSARQSVYVPPELRHGGETFRAWAVVVWRMQFGGANEY